VEYGNVYEKSMALSCEEVGRLVFSRTDKIGFTEMAYDFEDAEESEDGAYCIVQIEAIRNFAMELLQNRERAVAERVCEYLSFAQEAQELINLEEEKEGILAEELPELISRYRSRKSRGAGDYFEVSYRAEELGDCFDARIKSLSGMEILDEEWPRTACAMNDFFHAKERSGRYPEFLREFTDSGDYRETEYEQLMVYFTFRYFTKAVYDFNILSKARFAVLGFLTIRDMDCVRFYAQKQCFGLTDQIDTARIFSKEVEHSENNMEYLTEEFVFAEEFQIEKLYHQILIL
jgi:lysine-N-methylase